MPCRSGGVAGEKAHGIHDRFFFRFLQISGPRHECAGFTQSDRKAFDIDDLIRRQRNGSLDDVFQFAHIAWPRITHQEIKRGLCEPEVAPIFNKTMQPPCRRLQILAKPESEYTNDNRGEAGKISLKSMSVEFSLVLHHQMDRLVPGAFRLMANLVQPM